MKHTVSIEQVRASREKVDELSSVVKEIDLAIQDMINEGSFSRFKADEEFRAQYMELSDRRKAARVAHRVEEIVCIGLMNQHLLGLSREVIEFMHENVAKFDGQKMRYKRPANLLKEFAEGIGATAYVDSYGGTVNVRPIDNALYGARPISMYVYDYSWEGGESVYYYASGEIERNRERLSKENLLTEEEIREAAAGLLDEVEKVKAEKKRVEELVDDTKSKYRSAFGYHTVSEIEDL